MEKLRISHPISIILNGTNYVIWAQEMSGFLKGWKLWHCDTSGIPEPIKSEDIDLFAYIAMLEEWDSKNYQIITWSHNTCVSFIKL